MRMLVVAATLLMACPTTPSRPLEEPRSFADAPRTPLVDARAFVSGRLVAAEGGWRFEGATRSDVVPWPTGPARPGCYTPRESLAWPIEGTERTLVLDAEPLLLEERDGCLVATPLRTARPELGRRALTIPADAPPVLAVFDGMPQAPAGDLAPLTLTFEERDLPWLGTAGAEARLEPDGFELGGADALRCWDSEPGEEATPISKVRNRKVELIWRGSASVDELELLVTQTCGGDPSEQGGAVTFERSTRWLLERDPAAKAGWRQVHLAVAGRQRSGGDGVQVDESRSQVVSRWSAGEATLVGWSTSSRRESDSISGYDQASDRSDAWWVLPSAALADGLDALDPDARGFALAPDLRLTERDAEVQRTLTAPGEVALGRCVVRIEGAEATLSCGADGESIELLEQDGAITCVARSWDLGAALCVELVLARERQLTDPDDASLGQFSREVHGARFLVSKSSGALVKLGAWKGLFL